jgi:hypothetical protein
MEALHLLIRAGFIIHWEKSSLTPSTDFPFLGFQWNTVQALIAIPQVKIDTLHSQASILSNLTSPSCRQILGLTGVIAAFFKAVPLLCLKGRWLQISLNSVYSSDMDLQKTVILSPQARRDLSWILGLTPLQCFALLWNLSPEACNLEVQTDASKISYGIWFQGSLHQGHWDSTTTHLHINVLENIVLWTFLDCILPQLLSQRNILWRIDNTTALAYVKKEGGDLQSPSPRDCREDSDQGSPDVRPHPSSLHSHRGKHPGRRSILLPRDSRLAAASLSVPGDIGEMGSSLHRPLCLTLLQTDSPLLQLEHGRQSGGS